MEDLHVALGEAEGRKVETLTAKQITERAVEGCADSLATVNRFCAVLGSTAGDIALTLGARGGVFIAGGIAPGSSTSWKPARSASASTAKGRLSGFTQAIPTHVILHPHTALIGAAVALTPEGRAAVSWSYSTGALSSAAFRLATSWRHWAALGGAFRAASRPAETRWSSQAKTVSRISGA
ncbi:glucokinase [Caulobacter segnis]